MALALDRRHLLASLAAVAAGATLPARPMAAAETTAAGDLLFGTAKAFSFDGLKAQAKSLASTAWSEPQATHKDVLQQIDYDAYQQVKFRPEMSLRLDRDGKVPVQLFHLGALFMSPVHIHLVEAGEAREVLYDPKLFDTPPGHPARQLQADGMGFAGFRVMASDVRTDWLAFLGASYFRTSGPYNQYGLSARALAIDTAMPRAEEFPRFTGFWLESGTEGPAVTLYALMDSPSVAGAYRIRSERLTDNRGIHRIVMEIEADLHARKDIERLGIAPFSSMFWYGESSRKQAADWRPEIHDSDGLAVLTGSGERIWRPINNPPRVMTSTFVDRDMKGFGLMQRDRDFVHYLDDGVFYERRPSVWVEPMDPWGEGSVHLVEIPTDDEVNDNIVAYWCPKEPMRAGDRRTYRYRLTWLDDISYPEKLGWATATWTGLGGRPGHKRPTGVRKFVIDFQGGVFAGLGRNDGVEIVVTVSRGAVNNAYTHPVVDQRERWRALFDLEATGSEPVEMRAFLRKNGQALTETWVYQYFPDA
jgi:glucans biosynthesis protein